MRHSIGNVAHAGCIDRFSNPSQDGVTGRPDGIHKGFEFLRSVLANVFDEHDLRSSAREGPLFDQWDQVLQVGGHFIHLDRDIGAALVVDFPFCPFDEITRGENVT